jgi:molybdate transport system ATP-binding protein
MLYRKEITACDVVASGIFDSIGLYRNLDSGHKREVNRWIEFFDISHIANSIFTHLSFGERRMVLLARSMVKAPELLILDEPCQGLDQENRKHLMRLIEMIGIDTDTNLLYVTHYKDELPACIDHVLTLKKPEQNEIGTAI